ncbi:MAG: hypothetical protein GY742_14035 [Hyphomicrobiales bacterium]|nr:hypothetical protein [Hyphomicrobiales bacterium]
MEISVFLARIIGPLFVLIGVGVLLNIKHYKAMIGTFINNPELYYFSGAMAFVAGMAIVLNHNLWTTDWRMVITVLGWISIVKGVMRILLPEIGQRMAHKYAQSNWILNGGSIVLVTVGTWLAYEGFRT